MAQTENNDGIGKMIDFFKRYFILAPILLMTGLFIFAIPAACQEVSEDSDDSDWEDGALYISAGPNLSQYKQMQSDSKYPFKLLGEGGLMMRIALNGEIPIVTGIEFQSRGFTIDSKRTGTNQSGKYFEQRITGKSRTNFLQLPFLVQVPFDVPNQKFHVLAGFGAGLRVYNNVEYSGTYSIPSDTLVIPINGSERGNNALDFLEFNAIAGFSYKVFRRTEIWALANYKLFGLSIGQENFFSRNEQNSLFSFKLVYRIGNIENLAFF